MKKLLSSKLTWEIFILVVSGFLLTWILYIFIVKPDEQTNIGVGCVKNIIENNSKKSIPEVVHYNMVVIDSLLPYVNSIFKVFLLIVFWFLGIIFTKTSVRIWRRIIPFKVRVDA